MPPLCSHRLSTLIDTVFRLSSCVVSLSLIIIAASASLPAQNITIEVPAGTTNHGNLHLLCTPAQAQDILVFFAANYFARAATVKISRRADSGYHIHRSQRHLISNIRHCQRAPFDYATRSICKGFVAKSCASRRSLRGSPYR